MQKRQITTSKSSSHFSLFLHLRVSMWLLDAANEQQWSIKNSWCWDDGVSGVRIFVDILCRCFQIIEMKNEYTRQSWCSMSLHCSHKQTTISNSRDIFFSHCRCCLLIYFYIFFEGYFWVYFLSENLSNRFITNRQTFLCIINTYIYQQFNQTSKLFYSYAYRKRDIHAVRRIFNQNKTIEIRILIC